ncbi:MAG TPA: ParB/RepB/Spo0J family partition protein, partial [Pirellulales bacterium]|nr:ParB/RepB/Spo0J family partition protein [Pirellulales bacterium]
MATATKPRAKTAARKTTNRNANGHAPPATARDPRVNSFGVFESGFEAILIPLREQKAYATIYVIDYRKQWLAAAETGLFPGDPTQVNETLRIGCQEFDTRFEAIDAAGKRIEAWWAKLDRLMQGMPAAQRVHGCALDVSRWLADLPRHLAERDRDAAGLDRDTEPAVAKRATEPAIATAGDELLEVSIDAIVVSPKNPRRHFDQAELDTLASNIAEVGIIQPPRVRPLAGAGKQTARYELVAGERRWRAAKLAGLKTIRVVCRAMGDREALVARGVENLKRAGLNAMEEAQWCLDMTRPEKDGGGGHTQASLAVLVGKDPSWVSNRIRLLELGEPFAGWIISQEMPATHARCLLSYKEHPEILAEVAKQAKRALKGDGGLGTVAEFEREVTRGAMNLTGGLAVRLYTGDGKVRDVRVAPTPEQAKEL